MLQQSLRQRIVILDLTCIIRNRRRCLLQQSLFLILFLGNRIDGQLVGADFHAFDFTLTHHFNEFIIRNLLIGGIIHHFHEKTHAKQCHKSRNQKKQRILPFGILIPRTAVSVAVVVITSSISIPAVSVAVLVKISVVHISLLSLIS